MEISFLRILHIFYNSYELKIFTFQNKVEGFFKDHLFIERFICSKQSKTIFLENNLVQMSSCLFRKFMKTGELAIF